MLIFTKNTLAENLTIFAVSKTPLLLDLQQVSSQRDLSKAIYFLLSLRIHSRARSYYSHYRIVLYYSLSKHKSQFTQRGHKNSKKKLLKLLLCNYCLSQKDMALKYTAYGINNFDPGHIRLK